MKKIISLLMLFIVSISTFAMDFKSFTTRPKLLLVIVVDQLRADTLPFYQSLFLKEGDSKKPGGYNFLMSQGAYFPYAEYEHLQNMTCPGHATILTGALPQAHGIGVNSWYDKTLKKERYCVEDDVDGFSPRNMLANTLGDEIKNTNPLSRVFGISLKERSSILLTGHRANAAYWIDFDKQKWASSTYYSSEYQNEFIPLLNKGLNQKLNGEPLDKKYVSTHKGVELEIDGAIEIFNHYKLGRGNETDVLAVSLSTHDYTTHTYGPSSKQSLDLIYAEDRQISRLINEISKKLGGLDKVTIALTADHGGSNAPEIYKAAKMDAGRLDQKEMANLVQQYFIQKYKIAKDENIIAFRDSLNFFLDDDLLKKYKIDKAQALSDLKNELTKINGVESVFTLSDYQSGNFPQGHLGVMLKNTYQTNRSGDILFIPKPFWVDSDKNWATHLTNYSYDRYVPMIIVDPRVKKGIYQNAKVVDLAPTLAFLLNVTPPAKSTGKILEIMK